MNKSIGLLAGGLAFAIVLAGCASNEFSKLPDAKAAKPSVLKIGVIAPFSGDVAMYGEEIRRVLDYGLPAINARAAENGQRVELILEDGKCSGNEAVTAFQKLTDIDGVKVILGGICSSETLSAAPLAQAKGVLMLSGTMSNPALNNEGDLSFSLSYRDDLVGKEIANQLSQYQKVAMITEQNEYNIGLEKGVMEGLKDKTGIDIVADETFPKGATDLRNVLEKVAKARPDVLFLNPNPGVTAENLLKQLAEIPQLKGVKLVSQVAYLADDIRKVGGELSEGMVIVDAPKLTSPTVTTLMATIKKTQGSTDNLGIYYTASLLDALNILSDLSLRLDGDPQRMKQALMTETFEGNIGTIRFGDSHFVQGIGAGLYIVQNGKAMYQQ